MPNDEATMSVDRQSDSNVKWLLQRQANVSKRTKHFGSLRYISADGTTRVLDIYCDFRRAEAGMRLAVFTVLA
jgi:hypothetical protein